MKDCCGVLMGPNGTSRVFSKLKSRAHSARMGDNHARNDDSFSGNTLSNKREICIRVGLRKSCVERGVEEHR